MIFHVAERSDWEKRSGGFYHPAGFLEEGFIHLCTPEQLVGVVGRFYLDRDDLVLLTINPEKLKNKLVYEDLYGHGDEFPHLYGKLNVDAVVEARAFSTKE